MIRKKSSAEAKNMIPRPKTIVAAVSNMAQKTGFMDLLPHRVEILNDVRDEETNHRDDRIDKCLCQPEGETQGVREINKGGTYSRTDGQHAEHDEQDKPRHEHRRPPAHLISKKQRERKEFEK